MNFKETLNLPKTHFPMKANLAKREPEQLKKWEDKKLYDKILSISKTRDKYILHDGPPYANGHIHIGTALNKILKDFIIKSKFMAGYNSVYIPGWDCHGLPIEHQVDKELGDKKKDLSKAEIREKCRAFAKKFVEIQKEEFKRLGVFGKWEDPYLTMSFDYEATITREFGKFVANDMVYKGKKPIYWCASCKTALAEAEVEYMDHVTPSIYVKFPAISDFGEIFPSLKGKKIFVVIWTTTPWTIPANLAIALHPDYDYVAIEINDEVYITAEYLAPVVMQKVGKKDYKIIEKFPGKKLEGLKCSHPFINRESVIVMADYVTLDTGTGCVHTAPGHGQEDYETALKYGLDIYTPVDDDGRFTNDVPFFAGQFVFDANEAVNKKLKEIGALLAEEEFTHSYPHCWRCKNPIIFRATEQWFISMDKKGLRKKALKIIDKDVKWIPKWGKDRIYSMISNRPDWCISRQRSWGVPITIFYCKQCGTKLKDQKVIEYVADIFEKEGADAWFKRDAKDLIPKGIKCLNCGAEDFIKEFDILDVWFDSGVSYAAVCEKREELKSPADLYLEGSDQHRGWFHSSLLASVGTRGKAPYHAVLTHGFVVDGEGRKMSKSMNNVIAPNEIIDKFGAEILRLWVASEDYRNDIKISNEILSRLTEAYRKIRNTSRYILGNLHDFNWESDHIPYEEMEEIDRWILNRFHRMIDKVLKAYENFEFYTIYHSLYNFCNVDLSAFYLDILKDRIYTVKPSSFVRRSAQTALFEIIYGMAKLMAPIFVFTAEEIWENITFKDKEESVHLASFPVSDSKKIDDNLENRWEKIIEIRDIVDIELEKARKDKKIGLSLDARVELYLPDKLYETFKDMEKDFKHIFIVSQVELKKGDKKGEIIAKVDKAQGEKCPRCWNYDPSVTISSYEPRICKRCEQELKEMHKI
ncbi:MAG: isoleucine--tRNA ligase [Deltaproteobacteria bacterium]|nr:MAG: isoleucine--tRNA ligase [Deltaproteobacteria bacterium]